MTIEKSSVKLSDGFGLNLVLGTQFSFSNKYDVVVHRV
jgi:hypothetical protein